MPFYKELEKDTRAKVRGAKELAGKDHPHSGGLCFAVAMDGFMRGAMGPAMYIDYSNNPNLGDPNLVLGMIEEVSSVEMPEIGKMMKVEYFSKKRYPYNIAGVGDEELNTVPLSHKKAQEIVGVRGTFCLFLVEEIKTNNGARVGHISSIIDNPDGGNKQVYINPAKRGRWIDLLSHNEAVRKVRRVQKEGLVIRLKVNTQPEDTR